MPTREQSKELLNQYIKNPSLVNHCEMVAKAMEGYAKSMNLSNEEVDEWWTAGLLHDLDWEMFPDEHPNKAVNDILPPLGYSEEILNAIRAHAPDRTGKSAETDMEKYLFACDEISGFIYAVSLVRPTKFEGMESKSVVKRLKDSRFAANVSRDDINQGVELIGKAVDEHIQLLIEIFSK
jgi:predicted hydrolase (HD superfamily)